MSVHIVFKASRHLYEILINYFSESNTIDALRHRYNKTVSDEPGSKKQE